MGRDRSGHAVEQTVGDEGSFALPPFEAVELDLSQIFPPLAE